MGFSWKTKQQLKYFWILTMLVVIVMGIFFISNKLKENCFDGKKNQNEEEVDCGGKCNPCAQNLSEPIALWTRFFKEKENDNTYDLAALVENPNLNWGSENLTYSFKVFSRDNVLILEKRGKTFLNPGEQFIIFENGVSVKKADPYRASITIEPINNWRYFKKPIKPDFLITKKIFDRQSSVLEIEIKNNSEFIIRNIYLNAALTDKNGNIFAISETKINSLNAKEKTEAFFSWQTIFPEEPSQIEIIPKVNTAE